MNILGKVNNWLWKYVGVIIVVWGILMLTGGVYAFLTSAHGCPVQAAPINQVWIVLPTAAPTAAVPTQAAPTLQVEAMVDIQEADLPTYTYRLDEYGHAIWREAGLVPAGAMMKLGPCWEDGYRQVEYQDPARPSSWKVEYMKCIN